MEILLTIGFWTSAVAIAVTYFVYPGLMVLASRLPRRLAHAPSGEEPAPSVTMVIAAFNEAHVIAEKLENALDLDYPAGLEVMVISDGSTDGTDEIVAGFAARGVRLCRQEPRGGKSRGLTTFVPQALGQILIFSDANSMYRRDAVAKLVRAFEDPHVGYAVGYQRYREDDSGEVSTAERIYWTLESLVKTGETRLGSVVGGDGAIYAIRAELFEPLRDDDLSDFVNPLQIVARGYRGVFEPEAVCFEDVASSYEGEFRRKTRIVNRALRAVMRVPAALDPRRVGFHALQLLCHKVLRWFVPHFLVVLLLCTVGLALAGAGFLYLIALWGQLGFYLLAALKPLPVVGSMAVVFVPYYFCLANWAALLGTLGALTGRTITMWQPERS